MDTPPVLVAELNSGCIINPAAGDYELRAFCQVGEGEVTLVVDEETVGEWESCEATSCCQDIIDAGYTNLNLKIVATGTEWSQASGSWVIPISLFGNGCSGFRTKSASPITYPYDAGVATATWTTYTTEYQTYFGFSSAWINFSPGVGVVASISLAVQFVKINPSDLNLLRLGGGAGLFTGNIEGTGQCLLRASRSTSNTTKGLSGNVIGPDPYPGTTISWPDPPPGTLTASAWFT
jgi:hypothetical protein